MILDLFAGPGGWSEGLRSLGLSDIGIEWDAAACKTRAAAGHRTIRADVAQYPTAPFVGKVTGLIASPPCTAFSTAGKQAGTAVLDELVGAIRGRVWGALRDHPATVWLPLEVGRWVDALRPEWVACEQVPPALPLWEAYQPWLRSLGYSVWCGVLNAADFGIPQTRRRAFLMASRVGVVCPPEPTHAENPAPSLFGPAQQPWVSMAEGLGWGMTERPATTFCGGNEGGPDLAGGSGARERIAAEKRGGGVVRTRAASGRSRDEFVMTQPSRTLTGKTRSWEVIE